jgi:hypothetical protein
LGVGHSHLKDLRHVAIANIPELDSLAAIAAASNLKTMIIHKTPELPIRELEWMLHHSSLEYVNISPARSGNTDEAVNREAMSLLAPKFGTEYPPINANLADASIPGRFHRYGMFMRRGTGKDGVAAL